MATQAPPAIVLAHAPSFQLGLVEVRPGTRELIGPAGRDVIEPRVMQVLVALAEARGEILSRDDLIACCWDGRIVGDDAINRVISKIRRLGQSTGQGSFGVETITKVGYRLVTGGERHRELTAFEPASASPVSRRNLLTAGALAIAATGVGAWLWQEEPKPGLPEPSATFYRKGVEALRMGSPENNAQAIAFLKQTVAAAPNFADGWAALGMAYNMSGFMASPEAVAATNERGASAIRRALALDPNNATAHAALALAVPHYGNWHLVEAQARRALELDSRQFDARALLAFILSSVGRVDEAIGTLDSIGEEAAMLPLIQFRLATHLWAAGRLEESDRVIDRAMSLWPRNYTIWFTRFWLFFRTGRFAEAVSLSANISGRPIGIPEWNFDLNERAARAALSQSPAELRSAGDAHLRVARQGGGFAENAIQILCAFGRITDAFAIAEAYFLGRGFTPAPNRFSSIQGGYTRRNRLMTAFLFTPSTRPMQRDPRFATLMEETGLAQYWRRSGTQPDRAAEMRLPRL
jgi:DNA-binding winged helix-turn-helix (wHTH) protein/tetratricopeptide (TPR) repeat protein